MVVIGAAWWVCVMASPTGDSSTGTDEPVGDVVLSGNVAAYCVTFRFVANELRLASM